MHARCGERRIGQTYCVRSAPDATVPGRLRMCQYAQVLGGVSDGRVGWFGGLLTDWADGGHVENDGESLLEGWESG